MESSSSSSAGDSWSSQFYCDDSSLSVVLSYEDTDDVTRSEDFISDSEVDYVLLGIPVANATSLPDTLNSPACTDTERDLSSTFEKLSIASNPVSVDYSSEEEDLVAVKKAKRAIKRSRQKASRKAKHAAQREQTSADNITSTSGKGAVTPFTAYDEAAAFISWYIAGARGNDHSTELELLRSFIIELGVRSPNSPDLPTTLTSARKLIKSEVHVNIKEYLATRDQGQCALQQIMYPSKKSLRREIQRTGNKASLKWVKKKGLQVLLIKAFE
ncbi:hypothetical protein V8B97DRAFT_2004224 [Scleroderma yunnanense]